MRRANTDNVLIPMSPDGNGLDPRHGEFQYAVFRKRREKALAEVRMVTGVPTLVRELKPDRVYRLVVPGGKVLQKGKDGLFRGVFFGDKGKISKHAKFEKLPPNLSRIATAVGAQIMLVSIAMQLNRIESAIAGISEELHDDRIAQILAGIRQYEIAMQMTAQAHRDIAILNAIQSLVEGLSMVQMELRRRIADLPDPMNSFWDNWGSSKACRAGDKLRIAEEALVASVRGASVLSQCYAALDDPSVGEEALCRCLKDIDSCGVEVAAEKARIVEVEDLNAPPERPWVLFTEANHGFTQMVARTRLKPIHTENRSVTLEFMKNELLEEE